MKHQNLRVNTAWDIDMEGLPSPKTPMSPVQQRLEKRSREPGSSPRLAPLSPNAVGVATSPIIEAKKRRQFLLEATVKENHDRVARAKGIARKINLEKENRKVELEMKIEQKLQAAESRRDDILADRVQRARPNTPLASPTRRRSVVLENFESKISEAQQRREKEIDRRLQQVKTHLERVKARCDQVRMVRRVQDWWRKNAKCRAGVARFLDGMPQSCLNELFAPIHPGSDGKPDPTFEAIAAHLESGKVIDAARKFLDLLKPQQKRGQASTTTISATRSFLACFMIRHHANIVLGTTQAGEESKREQLRVQLDRAARNLYQMVNLMHDELGKGKRGSWRFLHKVDHRLRLTRTAHIAYARAFLSWKQVDALCLADSLMETYVQVKLRHLEVESHIKEQVQQNGPEDPGALQHLQGYANQMESIRIKVRKILGETQFKAWLRKARAEIAAIIDPPRENVKEKKSKAPEKKQPQAKMPSNHAIRTASLMSVPSNEEMVYELMLDSNYRLVMPKDEDMNFLDEAKLAEELENGFFELFLGIVDTIRVRLGALTPNRKDLVQMLDERLDIVLLQQELEQQAFDAVSLYRLVQFLGERILALQAPDRQEQTEAWLLELHVDSSEKKEKWTQLAPKALSYILKEIALIDIGVANFHLQVLSTHLSTSKNGAQYLQAKFEERMAKGEYALGSLAHMPAHTEAWISTTYDEMENPSLQDLLVDGYLKYITGQQSFQSMAELARSLPETFRELSLPRIHRFHLKAKQFCMIAVIDVLLLQILRAYEKVVPKEPELKEARHAIHALIMEDDHDEDEVSSQEFQSKVQSILQYAQKLNADKKLSEAGQQVFENSINQVFLGTSPLLAPVSRQLAQLLRKVITDPSANSSTQALKKMGLLPWQTECDQFAAKVAQVFQLNLDVHRDSVYHKIFVAKSQAKQHQ